MLEEMSVIKFGEDTAYTFRDTAYTFR